MRGRPDRRVIYAAATALLALWAVTLVVLAANKEEAPRDERLAVAEVPPRQGPFRGGPLPEGIDRAPAPRFTLAQARGGRLSTASLEGNPYLVTFLYTDCPDVCPLIAHEVKQALEDLGPRGDQVTAIAVSADPIADTPQAVRAWLKRNSMPTNFRYLVGTEDELQPVWKAHFAAPQAHDNPNSAHSASIWLVDRRGRWRTKFSGGAPVPPADIAHDLRILLDERA